MKLNSQNKTGTKLKILLAQIKAGNNSNNMKKKLDKHYTFSISTVKSLKNVKTI